VVRLRRQDGDWEIVAQNLSSFDSVMTRLADPRNAPEVLALRDSVRDWLSTITLEWTPLHRPDRLRLGRALLFSVTTEEI
jgi:hypothetical protein